MLGTKHLPLAEKLVIFGLPLITILVWTEWILDPVNLPKLVVLGILSFAVAPSAINSLIMEPTKVRNPFILLVFFSALWILLAVILSGSNTIQSFFGVTGRFTGALTYFSLYLLALFVYLRASSIFYQRILAGLAFAGVVNVAYCGIVILTGKDPIPWTNVYGNILGTFGNPNFISSFLGIFIIVLFSKMCESHVSVKLKVLGFSLIGIAFLEILDSKSRQGVIVTAVGCAAVLVYRIKVSSLSPWIKVSSALSFGVSGVFTMLGMLQIGPLSNFVYKQSVSIRGAYWRAGWETMLQNPVFGAGPDGFGDWYARVRDARAMVVPGPDVFTNSPHNVFIEQGANGGVSLFLAYLLLQIYIFVCGIRYFLKSKEFNFIFSASFFGWIGFTAQSLISINQIGLAVWGFVLGAMTVGLSRPLGSHDIIQVNVKNTKLKNSTFKEYQVLLTAIGASIGLAISVPPFLSDAKWRSAVESKSLEKITIAATQWPQSTDRYIQVTKALYENKFVNESLEFARKGVLFNPNSARLWYFLYQLPNSTEEEKKLAVERIKILDPYFDPK